MKHSSQEHKHPSHQYLGRQPNLLHQQTPIFKLSSLLNNSIGQHCQSPCRSCLVFFEPPHPTVFFLQPSLNAVGVPPRKTKHSSQEQSHSIPDHSANPTSLPTCPFKPHRLLDNTFFYMLNFHWGQNQPSITCAHGITWTLGCHGLWPWPKPFSIPLFFSCNQAWLQLGYHSHSITPRQPALTGPSGSSYSISIPLILPLSTIQMLLITVVELMWLVPLELLKHSHLPMVPYVLNTKNNPAQSFSNLLFNITLPNAVGVPPSKRTIAHKSTGIPSYLGHTILKAFLCQYIPFWQACQ